MPNTPDHPILVGFKKLSTYFLTPAMLVGIIWYYATSTESNKHVQFTDPVIKHKTEEHVKNSPNEAEQLKLNIEIKDVLEDVKADKTDAIRSRAKRDSIAKALVKNSKKRDSIQDLNNVTIFQIKETLERQTEVNKQILKQLEK